MKKNCVLLYAITLLIAFCFTQSMMAEKKSYMGYHYNGKINKENILEGEDVPKLKSQRNKIILEVDNFTIQLDHIRGSFNNWDEYFKGEDSLLILSVEEQWFVLQSADSWNNLRERHVGEMENLEKVINEYLLPNISNPNSCEISFFCYSDDDITKRVKVCSITNGVVLGRKQTAAAEKKAQQAEAAKRQANYNALCKKYGKKYVDAAVNGRIIIGMPEELMKKLYYCVLRYQSASRKKYDSADARAIIWVTNGRVSSISYY